MNNVKVYKNLSQERAKRLMKSVFANKMPYSCDNQITLVQLLEKNVRAKKIQNILERERKTTDGPIIVTATRFRPNEIEIIEEYNAIALSQV